MDNLSSLNIGDKAKIRSFDSHSKTRNILLSFGLYHDAIVEIVRLASYNDPICIRINNRLIAIRKKHAKLILIEKL